jgi:hypothetical protein
MISIYQHYQIFFSVYPLHNESTGNRHVRGEEAIVFHRRMPQCAAALDGAR